MLSLLWDVVFGRRKNLAKGRLRLIKNNPHLLLEDAMLELFAYRALRKVRANLRAVGLNYDLVTFHG